MKVLTTLLTILLISATLFCLTACNDTSYVQGKLSNEGKDKINHIVVPHGYSHNDGTDWVVVDGKISQREEINQTLSLYLQLQFTFVKELSSVEMQDFEYGNYGLPFDEGKWPEHLLNASATQKYLIRIFYENDKSGLLLVDYDGTVYFVGDNKKLYKTDAKAIDPSTLTNGYFRT